MPEIVAAIAALAGTALGGAGSYFIARKQFEQEDRVDRRRRLIQAYEEIYVELTEADAYAQRLQGALFSHVPEDAPQLDLRAVAAFDTARLEMLVSFYAPDLEEVLGRMKWQIAALKTQLVDAMVNDRSPHEERVERVRKGMQAQAEMSGCLNELKTALGESARSALGFDIPPSIGSSSE